MLISGFKLQLCFLFLLVTGYSLNAQVFLKGDKKPEQTVSVKIWDKANHNAFTDLVYYRHKFYCTFRESASHVPRKPEDDGKIRILVSDDGVQWSSLALLATPHYDLRDPNFSIMSDGRLMLLMGGSIYDHGKLMGMHNHVSFWDDAAGKFSDPVPINMDKELSTKQNWLWHLTWNKSAGYGVVYQSIGDHQGWKLFLVKTENGIDYSLVTPLDIDERGSETAVGFLPDGRMVLTVRRDKFKQDSSNAMGMTGIADAPFTSFNWQNSNIRLGGPELISLGDNLLLGTRSFKEDKAMTGVYVYTSSGQFVQLFTLPSGGDNSYPGMVLHNHKLYISYYSSHEGKASIYLASVPVKKLRKMIKKKGV